MNELKEFINSKQFEYHIIKEDDYFDFIIEHDIKLEKQAINDRHRDHVFVTDIENGDVIAYSALMKDYSFPTNKTEDAMTMATIYVNSEYRNRGISKKLVELSLEHIKNENKIFMRTKPTKDGENYSYNRISKIAKNIELDTIPHNLSFVYKFLDNKNILKNKNIDDKISLFNITCKTLLNDIEIKQDNITRLEDIDEFEHKTVLNKIIKNNLKNKAAININKPLL